MKRTKSTNTMPPVSVETLSRRAALAAMRADDMARLTASTWRKMATLSRNGIRMFGLHYADKTPEFERLIATRGFRDQVLVEYKADNLGFIKVQKPWDDEWLIVPCLHQEYANGLSLDAHTKICNQAKIESSQVVKVDAEQLERAKAELRRIVAGLQQEWGGRKSTV